MISGAGAAAAAAGALALAEKGTMALDEDAAADVLCRSAACTSASEMLTRRRYLRSSSRAVSRSEDVVTVQSAWLYPAHLTWK